MVTAGTLRKAPIFSTDTKRETVCDAILGLAGNYSLRVQAWAVMSNHYHAVISFEEADENLSLAGFLRHLHREIGVKVNTIDGTQGRAVMYQFWDTRLTFEKSWLARLNYVHQNPVHHGVAAVASEYRWCSARWFESNAAPAFVKSVRSFKIDRVRVVDDF
jgi:putative transposase